jgi:hypothetical protein
MTTPDLEAIEERLAAYDPVDTDDVMREVDSCHDDIRALLGMVRERGDLINVGAERMLAQVQRAEAAEAKLAEVSGQLALIQSVRVAEEEQLADVTKLLAPYSDGEDDSIIGRLAHLTWLAETRGHGEDMQRNRAKHWKEKAQTMTITKVATEGGMIHIGPPGSGADINHTPLQDARAQLAANTDAFRSIIASASYRLVWAVDGRGSPEQAVRAVEALGEAYEASKRANTMALGEVAELLKERDARPDISAEVARAYVTAEDRLTYRQASITIDAALRAHATKAKVSDV